MIERMIKNNLSLKRWRRFKSRKMAWYSSLILIFLIFLTFISPFIANNRPLYMSYQGKSYFPAFSKYHPKEFGITDSLVVNYRKLVTKKGATAIWPLIKWNPYESNNSVDSFPSKPTATNLLGTDESGRDVLARLLYGFKYSILYAVLVWALSFIVGVVLGGTMGFFGGKVDLYCQRIVEVFSTVPQFFLLIILVSVFTPSLYLLVIISTLFSWIPISYYARAEFLKNRKKEFVEAARSLGASTFSILFKHILPNSLVPIITFSPFAIAGNIVGLASLDYLGFGLPVPTPSWGEMLAQAQKHYTIAWWLAVYPSLALFFTLTLLNFVGEGVRDAMDPKMS